MCLGLCSSTTKKMEKAVVQMARQYEETEFEFSRKLKVADYLKMHWNIFFKDVPCLSKTGHNPSKLAERICPILSHADGPQKCFDYLRELQKALKQIDQDLSDHGLREYFGLSPEQLPEAIYFHYDAVEQRMTFLLEFEDGTGLIYFPSTMEAVTPVLDDRSYMIHLPLSFVIASYTSALGNRYCKTLNLSQVEKEAHLWVEQMMVSRLGNIEVDLSHTKAKVFSVLVDGKQPLDRRMMITKNIVDNARSYVEEVVKKVSADLETDEIFRQKFGLSIEDQIVRIEFLLN